MPDAPEAMVTLGLQVPASQVTRILLALRRQYPNKVSNLGNNKAFAAVVKSWINDAVTAYEVDIQRAIRQATLDKDRQKMETDLEEWGNSIKRDLNAIVSTITSDDPVPAPDPLIPGLPLKAPGL